MTIDEGKGAAPLGKVIPLPQVRRTSLSLTLLEFSHALVLMLWVGSLAGLAMVVIPALLTSLPDRKLALMATQEILERSAFLGCGAGAFLLITTLLMHLLSLRGTPAVLIQMALLVVMTGAAVLSQVLLAPRMTELARLLPAAPLLSSDPHLQEYFRLRLIETGCLVLQILAGVIVMLFAVRRWYRYLPWRQDPATQGEPFDPRRP